MRSIRHHLALALPLFAILFCIEYLIILDRVIDSYEKRLKENYSVIIVADNSVKLSDISHIDTLIERVERVDTNSVLERIKGNMDKKSLQRLKEIMPLFISVKLKRYAESGRMERLKDELMSIKGVKDVHIFEKVHDRLYAMLLFMKTNFTLFAIFLGTIAALLMVKQMTIWQYEHKERMQIMALFGAPVWLRSGVLFRLALVDAFIALAAVISVMIYLVSDSRVADILRSMGVDPDLLLRIDDFVLLAAASFSLALAAAAWVVMRFKEEQ